MQVLLPLHAALQSVALNDPLLHVSVGLRLALHLEAAADPATAASVLQKVSRRQSFVGKVQVLLLAVSFALSPGPNSDFRFQSCTRDAVQSCCDKSATSIKDASSHLQVIATAEAFRIMCLQAKQGSTAEKLLWISGSRSQPVEEVLAIMAGTAFAWHMSTYAYCWTTAEQVHPMARLDCTYSDVPSVMVSWVIQTAAVTWFQKKKPS